LQDALYLILEECQTHPLNGCMYKSLHCPEELKDTSDSRFQDTL